jgi:cephalosporin-C deacetylase-like acetyl esterase
MTPVGLRCWDAARLIDFAETQRPVDASRIGVAGLSGGGTVGLFVGALEERVKLAMIAGYYRRSEKDFGLDRISNET